MIAEKKLMIGAQSRRTLVRIGAQHLVKRDLPRKSVEIVVMLKFNCIVISFAFDRILKKAMI